MELLNEEYQKKETTLNVIYGRRRTGKTTLIKEFIKNKNSFYFFADTQSELMQIKRFQEQISEHFNDKLLKNMEINSWDLLFDYFISGIDNSEKFVFVIDEFQYLAKSNKSFTSVFQRIFDTKLKDKNLMVILCGSLISMMYSEVLSYSSPLYGRRTSQINLKQISFRYYNEFFDNKKSMTELIELYAVTGGIPKYIEMINKDLGIFENIEKEFLDKNKFLYSEPRFLLQENVNEVSTYFSILQVIAEGNHKLSKITSRLGVSSSKITQFLKKLTELDVIERVVPVTESIPGKSKKGLYFIKDNYLNFWFKYVFPYQNYLEIGNKKVVINKIKETFNLFVSFVFEEISKEILMDFFSKNNIFVIEKIGKFWNKNTEIDILALGENSILYGECKWSKKHIGLSVLYELKEKTKAVNKNTGNEYFALFSKSGFSEDLISLSEKDKNILLFDMKNFKF